MARLRLPSARLVFDLPQHDALAGKTQCGRAFHLRYLLRHLDVSNTCPLCRTPNPLMAPLDTVLSPRKWENDYWKGA
ncbi:hypothetical protein TNCV_95971 [Trichonephila clavipes]|nr:hypothetical protein TNCV_95971 [Trichonephila clavipes]